MDANEFSFEALFNCCDFDFDESKKFKKAYAELNRILETDLKESDLRHRLDRIMLECIHEAHTNSFKQGFSFAVKSIKFILKT